MIEDEGDSDVNDAGCSTDGTSDTEDAPTESCRSYPSSLSDVKYKTSVRCRSKSPKHREIRNRRGALFEPTEEPKQVQINREHAYHFMVRCVAYPISQPLLDNKLLLKHRDAALELKDLESVADKCEKWLRCKFPQHEAVLNAQMYTEKMYGTDAGDQYDMADMVVLWLYCQVAPCGSAHSLLSVRTQGAGRLNGFRRRHLVEITQTYTEYLCRREGKVKEVDEIMENVRSYVFYNMRLVEEETVETLSPEYYYDLLQHLLNITQKRHKMIYTESELNNPEAQIVRLREEAGERDSAMLLKMRRFSDDHYASEADASRALEEQKQTLRDFKENIAKAPPIPAMTGHPASPHQHLRKFRNSLSASAMANYGDEAINEFKLKFYVLVVQAPELPRNVTYFCTVKCSGCKNRKRSDYTLLKDEGKMTFYNQFSFKTRHPAPTIKIKLMKHRDGYLKDSEKMISSRATKLTIRYVDIKKGIHPCRMDPMKVDEEVHGQINVEYKYDIQLHESVKMVGNLIVHGGHLWPEERRNFFILYKGTSQESGGLKEISVKGEVLKMIEHLTDYDVIQTCWTGEVIVEEEGMDTSYTHGFTLFKEGEKILFYAPTAEEKCRWVYQIFLLTGQTLHTDRSRTSTSSFSSEYKQFDEDMWPTSNITAIQGKHSSHFKEIVNSIVDLNLTEHRPTQDGGLHDTHMALLMEYKHRYDITEGLYSTTLLDCLTRKIQEGYFVDPDIIQKRISSLKECVLTCEQEGTWSKELMSSTLFENLQHGLRFIFRKFPYNLSENQLFGSSLLLHNLAVDLKRADELGDLDKMMLHVVECSMEYEYKTYVAPTRLLEMGLDKYQYVDIADPLGQKVLSVLHLITSRSMLFLENFITFYSGSLIRHYGGINEKEVSQLAETFFSLYHEDLKVLVMYIPTSPDTLSIFKMLNVFCQRTKYLEFGTFHMTLLHKAFAVHILTFVERLSIEIIELTDASFEAETWDPVNSEKYNCSTVLELKDRLKNFRTQLEELQLPNPDFSAVLCDMIQEKTAQILMKYGCVIRSSLLDQLNPKSYAIPTVSLHTLNCLVGLYPQPPTTLDPEANAMDTVVIDCIKIVLSPVLNYLTKILSEWSDSLIVTLRNMLGVRAKIARVREFISFLDTSCIAHSKDELHPDFTDIFLLEAYSLIIGEIASWLDARKRFYQTQILVISELVEKIRHLFSRRYVYLSANPKELNTPTYKNIDNILRAKEITLLGIGKELMSEKVRESIKTIINDETRPRSRLVGAK